MKYFYELQDWFYQTEFYQEVLKELPEPFNNTYRSIKEAPHSLVISERQRTTRKRLMW